MAYREARAAGATVDAVRIDGRAVAAKIVEECRQYAAALSAQFGVVPHLAVVLVGDDPASGVYVRAKERTSARAGIRSTVRRMPNSSTTSDVCTAIDELAADPGVHGIIVQLPLPPAIDAGEVLSRIPVQKDADGFHLYNLGSLLLGRSVFPPCTPEGVMRLLDDTGINLVGANVVVVGASNIVGKPMAMMALHREATVTICHAKTRDLTEHTRLADVLICAVGQQGLITGEMVKPGAVVVDVGINRLQDGSIVGDVDVATVAAKASYLTPVPGGVGPMTVAVLISNTVRAAVRSVGLPAPRPDELVEVPSTPGVDGGPACGRPP
ncbi:bifunctional 5,10-methylenetetrahydrofolate dehydrogenase/5,10-methenyltetrahydrofolate cyclohydrolase [Nocardia sp. CA2R105]|uniref:bifunctional 5,10-methylenetetrahydrofolate dehydrogenase/5,10-methenyltetrahydrofolate cyclohydrolase n=1 Tax=Nocardia coffeae TaxID=2873381 RepID=UPI001CA6AB80|nr:bifunctional 5,10-methylenetetrahydrofolate dehydrogenase/5,10-methenyltetrahydrofolate cyclohydrolase [Nocardia coffeae]MBY8863384.1 bifunctional 5,10-methylenetetrahydrofolate dehydrogenase/5,10-methenyltetrahydrofolate cyclohydrolase [Nocardia coffeae]